MILPIRSRLRTICTSICICLRGTRRRVIRACRLDPLDDQSQHDEVDQEDQHVKRQQPEHRRRLLPDEVDEQSPVKVSARTLAGLGVYEECVEDHAEQVTCDDGGDEWLVARWVEG